MKDADGLAITNYILSIVMLILATGLAVFGIIDFQMWSLFYIIGILFGIKGDVISSRCKCKENDEK